MASGQVALVFEEDGTADPALFRAGERRGCGLHVQLARLADEVGSVVSDPLERGAARRGFTLLEVLVAVALLGVVVSVLARSAIEGMSIEETLRAAPAPR